MIPFDSIIVPLSAALGLSLIVERILEFAKNILEWFVKSQKGRNIPGHSESDRIINDLEVKYKREELSLKTEERAEKSINERIKIKAKLDSESDPAKRKELKQKLAELEKDGEYDERFSNSVVLVEPAIDADDGKTLKAFILQLLGFAAGIILAHFSGIQLFNSFLSSIGSASTIAPGIDYLFTGLLIGGGSAPMHILIRFITQRKTIVTDNTVSTGVDETSTKIEKPRVPAIISTSTGNNNPAWIDIPYNGGVDRTELEWAHKRKKNPDLIVYHHTAMSSRSTFEDVVRVIKNRTDSKGNHWLTGYNCVVPFGGSIHPFCRWDCYGNHAAGYNRSSLGIAFNGNFETDSKVPYSNPDGRYGSARPSEVQLKAAARVVTLWTFLYPIEVDFEKSIIPHNKISSKTCPGSEFPYDEFKKWVEFYRTRWDKSAAVKERIEEFKLKPYLYIDKEA